jgi:hypothetical protein
MDAIGLALIASGGAFLCFELIFLLPMPRRRSVQDDIEKVEQARSCRFRGE